MQRDKWTRPEELRQPGMLRILEAMTAIQQERPGQQASFAAGEPAQSQRLSADGGTTRA